MIEIIADIHVEVIIERGLYIVPGREEGGSSS
jgi:hypothetical protein